MPGWTSQNAARFAQFSSTATLFLPGGAPPAVGSTLRNPDLAKTYREIGKYGISALYGGRRMSIVQPIPSRPCADAVTVAGASVPKSEA